ncbi:hypothetical protein H7H51_29825, partial [Mycolicibacterium farcinogenes]|nr:hypothetical protein [Mycolicibacterium farcinogenes]
NMRDDTCRPPREPEPDAPWDFERDSEPEPFPPWDTDGIREWDHLRGTDFDETALRPSIEFDPDAYDPWQSLDSHDVEAKAVRGP